MSIFNINGTPLSSAYNINGVSLTSAYDIDGNEVLTGEVSFLDNAIITDVYVSSTASQPQGGCIDDDGNVYVCFYSAGKFLRYNINTGASLEKSFTPNAYGHANGMTYNPNTEKLYLASMNDTGEVFVFDKSFNLVDTLYARDANGNVFTCWNIAYDRNSEQFITIAGYEGGCIRFFDNSFNYVTQNLFTFDNWGATRQDLETDGTYLYGVSWNPNKIFVLDFQGNVIKEIGNSAFTGEPESLCYDWIQRRFYIEGISSTYVIRSAEIKQ